MKATLLNRILVVLAFLGLFIAGVLSLEAGLNLMVPCGASGGCAIVAAAPSSHLAGIPVAYFGVVGYLVLAAMAVFRTTMPTSKWGSIVTLGYFVSAVGSAESLWLQYQSFYVIGAKCPWCISSAVDMIATLVIYALLAQEVEKQAAEQYRAEQLALLAEPSTGPDGVEGETTAVAVPVASPASANKASAEFRLPAILSVVVIGALCVMATTMKHGANGTAPPPKNANASNLVPPGAHILGDPSSPLTVVEFADLCCPTCQRISPQVKEYVLSHPGKVRMVYRNFPLQNLHPQATTAAAIAECAADDNRFWEYESAVMALQRQPKDAEELLSIAQATGLDVAKIRARLSDANDPAYARLDRDMQTVHALGINSTPTFITMWGGKVQETVGSNQIIDSLKSDKYQKIMNGGK